MRTLDSQAYEVFSVHLKPFQFELITLSKQLYLPTGGSIACLGLIDKYNSLAGISSVSVEAKDENTSLAKYASVSAGRVMVWLGGFNACPSVQVLANGVALPPANLDIVEVTGGFAITFDLPLLPEGSSEDSLLYVELEITE